MTVQPAGPGGPDIMLGRTGDPPACPRCGRDGLLSAQVPHEWRNNRGTMARGTRAVVLCPRCDASDPAARPLLLFFAVHGQVTGGTAEEFAALLRGWASQAQAPDVDQDALEAELQAWRRGELDLDEPLPAPGPYLPGDDRLEWSDEDSDSWP